MVSAVLSRPALCGAARRRIDALMKPNAAAMRLFARYAATHSHPEPSSPSGRRGNANSASAAMSSAGHPGTPLGLRDGADKSGAGNSASHRQSQAAAAAAAAALAASSSANNNNNNSNNGHHASSSGSASHHGSNNNNTNANHSHAASSGAAAAGAAGSAHATRRSRSSRNHNINNNNATPRTRPRTRQTPHRLRLHHHHHRARRPATLGLKKKMKSSSALHRGTTRRGAATLAAPMAANNNSATAANHHASASPAGVAGGGGSGAAAGRLPNKAAMMAKRRKKPVMVISSTKLARKKKKVRVCVLSSSYEGSKALTASVDNFFCSPVHYVKKNKGRYSFSDVSVKKDDAYRVVRELVASGKYDVFFNLCDGGKDEDRAGVEVVRALEEMNAAFTGTDCRSFEPDKISMKLLVGSCGVRVPNFVLLQGEQNLAKNCRHLHFPVIVKHISGYASEGIDKDNRCDTLEQLRTKVHNFIARYNHAMVEEFIRGREGTVLACADTQSTHGVKVFRPLMFKFLYGPDDFAYFDKKWKVNFTKQAYEFMATSDPAYAAVMDMARNAYKFILNGVGYGRVDFRIDDHNEPYFLEINPNCGMWYSEKDGGDYADVMVQSDVHWDHERFFTNAVSRALREQAARKPWYIISHDKNGHFTTRASRSVPAGRCLFGDLNHPIPVITRALYKLGAEEPAVGCVVRRGDGIQTAVAIRHSCEPNMQFVHGRTLLFASKRPINVGEELTVDYATLRDENMPHFACSCGTKACRSVIFPIPALPRTFEVRPFKRMLREKKAAWLKKKAANKEAEKLLKKRTTNTSAAAAHAALNGSNSNTTTSGGATTNSGTSAAGGGSNTSTSSNGMTAAASSASSQAHNTASSHGSSGTGK